MKKPWNAPSEKKVDKRSLEISKHFEKTITSDGTVINVADDFYVDVLPKGLTKEIVEKVQDFRSEIVTPYVQRVAELSLDIMEKNDDILSVTANAFYGKEELTTQIHRKVVYTSETPDAQPIELYGQVVTSNKVDMGKYQEEYDNTIADINDAFLALEILAVSAKEEE